MKTQQGVTLIEMVAVLVIGAILMVAGVPALRTYVLDSRLSASANTLVAVLNYARTEAITRGHDVYVTAGAVNSGQWTQGWQIWHETRNANGTMDDATNELLKEIWINSERIRVIGPTETPSASTTLAAGLRNRTVVFRSNGAIFAAQTLQFTLEDSRLPVPARRCLEVQRTGRVELSPGACSS